MPCEEVAMTLCGEEILDIKPNLNVIGNCQVLSQTIIIKRGGLRYKLFYDFNGKEKIISTENPKKIIHFCDIRHWLNVNSQSGNLMDKII